MKRHGCIDCRLIEPVAGQWVGGRCPSCTKLRAEMEARKPVLADPPKFKEDATVRRLQGYLKTISGGAAELWRAADELREKRTYKWPAHVFLPNSLMIARIDPYGTAEGNASNASVAALPLIAWRPTQGIYRFDETILSALIDTPLESALPKDVLHNLPEWCVYVETSVTMPIHSLEIPEDGNTPVLGYWCWLDFDIPSGREFLRFALDNGRYIIIEMPLDLSRESLLAGVESSRSEILARIGERKLPDDGVAMDWAAMDTRDTAQHFARLLNPVLYLCSVNAEIRARKPGLRPRRPQPTKTKVGMRMFPPPQPIAWDVGFRLGAAIRRAQDQERTSKSGDGTHASPRPHIRRAHWHAFWTGPRAKVGQVSPDRKLVLKWLPPMAVNVDDDLEPVPTIHAVK